MGKNKLAVLVLMLCFAAPALANNPACQRKSAEIQQQIEQAKQAGNHNRIRGLEKALSRVKENCTNATLIADKKKDIADQQEDIDEILQDIQKNQSEGRLDKVRKLERKLQRERDELEVLKGELRDIES